MIRFLARRFGLALGTLLGTREVRRTPDDMTLFLSVGLAGTEVLLARALLQQ